MTKRQHTQPRGRIPQAKGLRREAFPALRAFLRGYLHQDYPEVHGTRARGGGVPRRRLSR